jgi:MFS family permease
MTSSVPASPSSSSSGTSRTGSSPVAVAAYALPIIIASGCLIAIISFGPRSALGLFFAPMIEARGWSREVAALAIAIQNLLWGAGQPIAGMVADRYGTGRVLVAGAVLYCIGLIGTAYVTSGLMLQLFLGVFLGLGLAAASFSIVLAAFGRAVTPEKRSIAFGIGTAAGSLGQFLFAPLGLGLIEAFGWDTALVVLGVGMLAIIPLAAALRGRAATHNGPAQSIPQALREAFGHGSYVLLVIGFFVCGFHVAFITTHLPPFIADMGLSPGWGAWAIALIGLFNIIGSLGAGFLGQRLPKQKSLAFIYLGRSAVILLFILFPVTPASVLVFAAAMGLLWLSTVPFTSGLVAVMFGPRYMATLFGFVFFSHQIGAFLGVWLGGRLYDQTGSYDMVWWISIGLGVFAALVHWPISEAPVARLRTA